TETAIRIMARFKKLRLVSGTAARLVVRLTRQDMANMVGVTTETAIRIMARFKKLRLVSGTAARLVVRDLPRLKQVAAAKSV
ncbi:MAG TPA: helix-turn-helix domain-containing protein, partial [Nitrospiraceae bacterium]|nr:helix-turn-helix domain-containing protein [Nitrospiraceae bacterium]